MEKRENKPLGGHYKGGHHGNNQKGYPKHNHNNYHQGPHQGHYSNRQNNEKHKYNSKEMEQVIEQYNRLKKKVEQYMNQNAEISEDNKIKSKKIKNLQKESYNQQNKIKKIQNSVKLSLHTLEDTQESKEKCEKILKNNQICQNGDNHDHIQDITVYGVIYAQIGNNIQFLIGNKRKKQYWFPDSKRSGYKQIFKNGFIVKQINTNQLSFPGSRFNTYVQNIDQECEEKAKQCLAQLLCLDISKYDLKESPKLLNDKNFSVYFFHVSQEDLKNIENHCIQIFEKTDSVINNELKVENSEIDDSLEGHSQSYEKLMKKYGWVQKGEEWDFKPNGPAPQVSLYTSLNGVQIIDYERDLEIIQCWKRPNSGLDWYYSAVSYLFSSIQTLNRDSSKNSQTAQQEVKEISV